MTKIYVTKSFLPPIDEYKAYVDKIWESHQLTNNGPLLKEFESSVKQFLDLKNFQFVSNGTIALQVALEAMGIKDGEIITTPFTYVATTASILWQRCEPVFVDINKDTLCIDVDKIEAAITPSTKAIMPVHVFGNPCDVDKIEKIAEKHKLKVIYDAAHAFGVTYKGKSLLDYGDASTVSFHATKLFHTIEGGGIVTKDSGLSKKVDLIKRFGHHGDEHFMLGINAKANEFQAAMGLANLPYIQQNIDERRRLSELYDSLLANNISRPSRNKFGAHNYIYYPVIFKTEDELLAVVKKLSHKNIFPRRYFYPSLNTLPYLHDNHDCPVSEDISKRILCLPLYAGLQDSIVKEICKEIAT